MDDYSKLAVGIMEHLKLNLGHRVSMDGVFDYIKVHRIRVKVSTNKYEPIFVPDFHIIFYGIYCVLEYSNDTIEFEYSDPAFPDNLYEIIDIWKQR